MKTYVLTVSRYFPATHKRKGQETNFIEKIDSINCDLPFPPFNPKIHTIRANYELWEKRIKEVQEGKAILSIRYWSDKPYNSKQVEICQINKDSGCGVQQLTIEKDEYIIYEPFDHLSNVGTERLSKNDGLSPEDFKEWFRKADLSKPMAIIHFTSFRY